MCFSLLVFFLAEDYLLVLRETKEDGEAREEEKPTEGLGAKDNRVPWRPGGV